MQKLWVKAAAAVAVLVVVIIVAVPFFINADMFRPKIENELSISLGRKVTVECNWATWPEAPCAVESAC